MNLREKLRKAWEALIRGHAIHTYTELYMNQIITREEYVMLIKEVEKRE